MYGGINNNELIYDPQVNALTFNRWHPQPGKRDPQTIQHERKQNPE
jgi:hypothetical protein